EPASNLSAGRFHLVNGKFEKELWGGQRRAYALPTKFRFEIFFGGHGANAPLPATTCARLQAPAAYRCREMRRHLRPALRRPLRHAWQSGGGRRYRRRASSTP